MPDILRGTGHLHKTDRASTLTFNLVRKTDWMGNDSVMFYKWKHNKVWEKGSLPRNSSYKEVNSTWGLKDK